MPFHVINFQLTSGGRLIKRKTLIERFLNELPGTGNGSEASRYQYNVESYGEYGIFLKRPTQLNKGFDFTVNIEGVSFKKNRKYNNPSHQDIFDALSFCKINYPDEYNKVKNAIIAIYECEDADISNINAYFCDYEGSLHPIQIILLAIKWLFMEQDCAYWNYSGRRMFYDGLSKRELV